MSLLHALDPGASPSRPGCEARGCRSTSTTSVRAYLGRPHPTTLRVCERHRRDLEIAGDLENPVSCLIPECGRTRAALSRLCVEHDRIVVSAKIRIPKTGVLGTETLLKVRKAVEAEEKRQATSVTGLPTGGDQDIIVPLTVAAAMRELQVQHRGRVFTPGMVKEENGVKYAPDLIRHPDLEMVMRGGLTF